MIQDPPDSKPSFSAVVSALRDLQEENSRLTAQEEALVAKRFLYSKKLAIALHFLTEYTKDVPPAPDRRFPELNHYDEE